MSPSSPILITIDSNEAARPEDRGSGRRKTGNQTVDGDKQIREAWGGEGMNALKSILKENGWVGA